jgi:hypothetical protein
MIPVIASSDRAACSNCYTHHPILLRAEPTDPLYIKSKKSRLICRGCRINLEELWISRASTEELLLQVNYEWYSPACKTRYLERLASIE